VPRKKSRPSKISSVLGAVSDITVSQLEAGWPPAWSVSFADLTTLLMCGFVLMYALTAIKIPADLLAIKEVDQIIPDDIELLKEMKQKDHFDKEIVSKIRSFSPRQRVAIRDVKLLNETKENLESFTRAANLEGLVRIEVGVDAILITPRSLLLFREGAATLKEDAFLLLDKIVDIVKPLSDYEIKVEGHTDPTPIGPFHRYRYPSNVELSYARALSVADYFISHGISPRVLGVSGYGALKPRFPNDTAEGRMMNRRVDIYIYFTKLEEKT